MFNFPGSYQYLECNYFPQNIITTQTLQIIDFNSMSDNVKIGTFMLKISRLLLLLEDFKKRISKFQENYMCSWNTDASGHNKVHMRVNRAHVMSIHCCCIFTIATRLLYHVVELNFDKRFWHNMGECFFTLENKQWNIFSMLDWSHDLKHRGRS